MIIQQEQTLAALTALAQAPQSSLMMIKVPLRPCDGQSWPQTGVVQSIGKVLAPVAVFDAPRAAALDGWELRTRTRISQYLPFVRTK